MTNKTLIIQIRKQIIKSLSLAQLEQGNADGEAVIEREADKLLELFTTKLHSLEESLDKLPAYMIKSRGVLEVDSDDEFGFIRVIRKADVLAAIQSLKEGV